MSKEKKKMGKWTKRLLWITGGLWGVFIALMIMISMVDEPTPEAEAEKPKAELSEKSTPEDRQQWVDEGIEEAQSIEYTDDEAQKWLDHLISKKDKIGVVKSRDYIRKAHALMNHYGEGTPEYDFAKAFADNMTQAYVHPNKVDGYAQWLVEMTEAEKKLK